MVKINTAWISKQLAVTANTCTITTVSISHGSDEYRTESETIVDYTSINCQVLILSEEDASVKQGEARAGDLVFWFDFDQEARLTPGNKITFDSKTYKIQDVKKFDRGDTTYLIECRTRKI